MTVKRGDIVFVTQAHVAQEVAAVVLQMVPSKLAGLPDAKVHILSSSDPYSSVTVSHREFADDAGYIEIDESEPTENRPKEVTHADASQELSEGGDQEPNDEGDGTGLVSEEQGTSEESNSNGEGEPEEESEEIGDEPEEGEGSAEVSEDESDGESVPPTRRKRGGRSKR